MFYQNRAFILFSISILFLFAGCDGYMPEVINIDFDKDAYYNNLKKWKDHNIDDYKFRYENLYPDWDKSAYNINVKNRVIESYSYSNSGTETTVTVNSNSNRYNLKTIDEIFDKIINDYNSLDGETYIPNEDSYCTAIDVTYNSTYGFPELLSCEYHYPPENRFNGTDGCGSGGARFYIKNFEVF